MNNCLDEVGKCQPCLCRRQQIYYSLYFIDGFCVFVFVETKKQYKFICMSNASYSFVNVK